MTPPARVTVVESIYYQSVDQQPVAVDSRYGIVVVKDEQPFSRKMLVKKDWQGIDVGWIEDCCLLSLSFDAPTFSTNPTEETRREWACRVIEVGIVSDSSSEPIVFALLRPGESLRLRPTTLSLYFVRCRTVDVRCSLNLFPAAV